MRAELFGNREKERDTAARVSCKRSLIWFELETSECFLGFLEWLRSTEKNDLLCGRKNEGKKKVDDVIIL